MPRLILLLLFTCLASFGVQASNLSFLNNSAITYFNELDKNLMVQNAMRALESRADNTRLSWSNPKSGAWGYAIPSKTTYKSGLKCRQLTLFNSAKDVTGKSTHNLCKIAGQWKYH